METMPGKYINQLRECIKYSGYTIQEVARLTNIPSRTLSDYCSGKTSIPHERLEIIAQLLSYPIEELVSQPLQQEVSPEPSEERYSAILSSLQNEQTNRLRRELLQQTPTFVGTTLMTSSHTHFGLSLLDRLSQALLKPSNLDKTTINYLEMRTVGYWQDRHAAMAASCDLLGYVLDHLYKLAGLLEGSLLPDIRTQLCSIACKTSLLAGELFLDMSDNETARRFQEIAIIAAQEVKNPALESVAWGRLSLAWIYSKNAQKSLDCIQKARSFSSWNPPMVNAWLAAIEAEAQASRFDTSACLLALEEAERIEEPSFQSENSYLIHFDHTLLQGYQGACFRKLYRPEESQSTIYLDRARDGLLKALDSLDAALLQRRPTFLADLAEIAFQQKEIEEACHWAIQAVSVATPIKLQKVLNRLFTLRQQLEPWKDSQHIKSLDNHLALASYAK